MTGEKPTVFEALSRVMDDVQAVRKGDRNTQQGFNFRGIDAVINAVGPALRRHGVLAVPTKVTSQFEQYETSKGTAMRNTTLTIDWTFYGPAGDSIPAQTMGEASDAGDKSVSKAHSVAYRTLLLQALCIPTDEPDPDAASHERSVRAPVETATVEEFLHMISVADDLTALGVVSNRLRNSPLSTDDKQRIWTAGKDREQQLTKSEQGVIA